MAKIEDDYKINLEINKEGLLKDLKEIKEEVKSVTKEINTNIQCLKLNRKDILVVKVDLFLKEADKLKIAKQLGKRLHRKVLVIYKNTDLEIIKR